MVYEDEIAAQEASIAESKRQVLATYAEWVEEQAAYLPVWAEKQFRSLVKDQSVRAQKLGAEGAAKVKADAQREIAALPARVRSTFGALSDQAVLEGPHDPDEWHVTQKLGKEVVAELFNVFIEAGFDDGPYNPSGNFTYYDERGARPVGGASRGVPVTPKRAKVVEQRRALEKQQTALNSLLKKQSEAEAASMFFDE